jgi:5-methylcytosine-specific restriction endonuclease McrA
MNDLEVADADEDGFIITDRNHDKCYVYYSEIQELFQKIRKLNYDKNIRGQHSSSSKKEFPNEMETYKSFEKKQQEYNSYIQSDEWKDKRRQRLNYDAHRCINCGSKVGVEVHHKNYDCFGGEDVKQDLVTLCRKCHNKVTLLKKKKYKGIVTEYE